MWFQYDPATDTHVKINNRYHCDIMASYREAVEGGGDSVVDTLVLAYC